MCCRMFYILQLFCKTKLQHYTSLNCLVNVREISHTKDSEKTMYANSADPDNTGPEGAADQVSTTTQKAKFRPTKSGIKFSIF